MTNHWIDLKNSDCIIVMGSNAAENHPMSFRWVLRARDERGARIISVDPRFTRTSALADIYAPLRSGTDIAFIGGLINYCLTNQLYNHEYVVEYTNAGHLISPDFSFSEGLFSGYDQTTRKYDNSSWAYQLDENGIPREDRTLQDPRCVFQLLKSHFARYDADTVCKVTGTPRDKFLEVARTFCATGDPRKAGTIMYAMGFTQHTTGTQIIRAFAILQLLLGNIGIAGGGVNALRGEPNVQGSTDYGLLFHLLPGYLKAPVDKDATLQAYLDRCTPVSKDPKSVNYWKNYPKFMISLLKAWYGENATPENEFSFHLLPKASGNYSHMSIFQSMYQGKIRGLFCWGQNPAVSGPNALMEQKALEKLDWLVCTDIFETETSIFWKRPGVSPSAIKTEVFLLPAASSAEKEGSISNSGRWAQWRNKCEQPPGEAKSDLWIINALMLRLKKLYAQDAGPFPDPITKLSWKMGSPDKPSAAVVAREINGYDLSSGRLLDNFTQCLEDGTTSSGCWIYSGSFTEAGNMMARRGKDDPTGIGLYPGWSWCWPLNRRIIYNRASCDPKGRPWDPDRAVIWWNETMQQWEGDVPDYGKKVLPADNVGAFIMRTEGHARLFGPDMADGPFPEHYEPYESPVDNIFSPQQINPCVFLGYNTDLDRRGDQREFPIVATTYRITEHWQSGIETRWQPWLCELMPEMFVELSRELAKEKGINNGDLCTISSARGSIRAVAMVTARFRPFPVNGRTVHQIGLPWCYGYAGLATGDPANVLTPNIGDPNTRIPEYKAFLCNVRKGV